MTNFHSDEKNQILVDHITVTLQTLLTDHENAGVIICCDRNDLPIDAILSADSALRQIVHEPTHGQNTLDVIYTNLGPYYNDPITIPSLSPDVEGNGVPSDHLGVECIPNQTLGSQPTRNKQFKLIRPFPASLVDSFVSQFSAIDFTYLNDLSTNEMVACFEYQTSFLINKIFPQKRILVSHTDQPWFTEELRLLKRNRQREYQKHGKSVKYIQLCRDFENRSQSEIEKYKLRLADQVLSGSMGSCYSTLRKLGNRVGDNKSNSFKLPNHSELGLTAAQSVEKIAEHFTQISAQFQPLDPVSLPQVIQDFLAVKSIDEIPTLSVKEVEKRIRSANKPNSIVPGDLPKKLVQSCPQILAIPATIIFNHISQTSQYPDKWKLEQQIAIPKVSQPECEDDLRNIAKTPFLSKIYEFFLAQWLLNIIQPYIDPGQCGLKGFSISHYLIRLLHFVHSTLDTRNPQAVIAACIDLGKAFNRVDHQMVIQDLYDMKTPSWLLSILISYLSNRSMVMSYEGAQSSQKLLPAGTP